MTDRQKLAALLQTKAENEQDWAEGAAWLDDALRNAPLAVLSFSELLKGDATELRRHDADILEMIQRLAACAFFELIERRMSAKETA